MKKLFALCLVFIPLQAAAEIMHYSKCTLNDGKTIADVQKWATDWRALVKKKGLEYQIRLLVPHADSTAGANVFFIEGSSPNLQSYAKAWEWWYTDAEAAASNKQATALSSCDAGSVYRTAD